MNPAQAFKRLDWVLILSVLTLVFLGLTTMKSFSPPIGGEQGGDYFFNRQIVWIFVGLAVFFVSAIFIDWSFLKTNRIFLMILYLILILRQ